MNVKKTRLSIVDALRITFDPKERKKATDDEAKEASVILNGVFISDMVFKIILSAGVEIKALQDHYTNEYRLKVGSDFYEISENQYEFINAVFGEDEDAEEEN